MHRREGRLATVTAAQPPGRFGVLDHDGKPDHRLQGEAARRRRLGQRRLLRAVAQGRRDHRGRRHGLGARPAGAARRRRASSACICIAASGSRWTRCATRCCWKTCGRRARRRGRSGHDRARLLAGPARAAHRPHRLQGRVAGALARTAGRARCSAWRCRPTPSPRCIRCSRRCERPALAARRHPRSGGGRGGGGRGAAADRHPHGGAGAGAALVSRAGRDVRHQRHGHRAPARRAARRRRARRPCWSSPPTRSIATTATATPSPRTTRSAAPTPTRPPRPRPRSWSPAWRASFFAAEGRGGRDRARRQCHRRRRLVGGPADPGPVARGAGRRAAAAAQSASDAAVAARARAAVRLSRSTPSGWRAAPTCRPRSTSARRPATC